MTDPAVRIFDTTLRDGEQAPGFSMDRKGKLRVAHALAALRVDVIEAGFAAASPGDAAAIAAICEEIDGPTICSLARATRGDIDAAARALSGARRKRIHVFIGTSPLHREAKLNMHSRQVIEAIRESVSYAREMVEDVEFSAEDAFRTEQAFLVECLSVAAEAGASTLNVPDTVGYTTPEETYELFRLLDAHVARDEHVIFSAHCHDDLGMAVANSLAAVRGGARQVECAINGIGERAGNCALEAVVMALKTRSDLYGVTTRVDTTQIMAASRALAQVTNVSPPRNKAIVGANAFAHEAGIHQHGVLQNRETYEIMKPEDVGASSDGIVLGKHSGRHALAARAAELGFDLEGERLDQAFDAFKRLADEIGTIDSARLIRLIAEVGEGGEPDGWALSKLEIRTPPNANAWPIARVELEHATRGRVADLGSAPGALDAIFASISHIMNVPARVDELELQYIAAGPDEPSRTGQAAQVLVEIALDVGGEIFRGRARDRDILPCCVAAYVDAASNAGTVGRVRATSRLNAKAA